MLLNLKKTSSPSFRAAAISVMQHKTYLKHFLNILEAGLGGNHMFEIFQKDLSTSDHECRDDQVFSRLASIL